MFDRQRPPPWASVNFITAHDGFTLNDLVTYNEKHNEANGEDNRDGQLRQPVLELRRRGADRRRRRSTRCAQRQMRNLLATLLLSQGTPMLLAGDEFGRTQDGNNNAYCQDNEISWLDWEHRGGRPGADPRSSQQLIALRRQLSDPAPQPLPDRRTTTRSSTSRT